ncbi:MAG TPA: type VI secretion system-associated protein TagF [Polyangiaceae bacterium]|jgi:type VI secretion system ImpM family protein
MPARHHQPLSAERWTRGSDGRAEAVAIGKFAREVEYLRPPPSPLLARFDSWLNEGFELAAEQLGTAWPALFGMGAPYGFVWRAGGEGGAQSFCGVLAPSEDAVGRAYPLALGALVSSQRLEGGLHVAPLAIGEFLDVTYAALAEARAGSLSRTETEERMAGASFPSEVTLDEVAGDYQEWTEATDADEGWATAFARDDAALVAREVLARLRSAWRAEAPLAVRLPVGEAPAGASALWLDALERSLGPSALASALWAVYDSALFVAIGAPPANLLTSLWARGVANPAVIDVADESWRRSLPASPHTPRTKCSMHSFLTTLSTPARR